MKITCPITTTVQTVTLNLQPTDGQWLSDIPALALGIASIGVSPLAARADHTHAMPGASDVGADPVGSAAAAQAHAVQRDHHTGTQLASTISNFNAAAAGAAPVQSVAGRTGAVTLTPSDVGADPAGSAATAAAAAQAHAIQRSNHTGTQLASTISNFNAAAAGAAPVQSVAGKTGAVTLVPSDVGADPVGSATSAAAAAQGHAVQRSNHTGTQAISTIEGLQTVIDNFAALLESDDTSLDTLQEVVDFIQLNRESLDSLTVSSIAGLQTALIAAAQRSNHTGTQLASTISNFDAAAAGAAPVQSVAGRTGTVTLGPSDVGADPAGSATTAAGAAQAHAIQRSNHTGTQLASTISNFDAAAAGAAPVQSVAGKTGTVTLGPSDVGADPAGSANTAAAAAQAFAIQRGNHTGTQIASTISNFNAAAAGAAPVQSVAGKTGAVTLVPSDVGADPAGSATTAAAAAQAHAIQRSNHTGTQSADTLTDGTTNKAFTAAEKSKVAGIETGATVTNAVNVGTAIAGVTAKATPVDADSLWITDSAASNAPKRVTFANLKTWVTGVINTWWGTVTTAVKTTGDQSIAGLKTHAISPRSTGAADADTSLITKAQGSALMMSGFAPMRKFTGTHNNLTGSVLTFDLSAPSPNWNGPLGSENYWRTLELIISSQHSGSSSGQFILYRAMIFFREYGGTWHLLGQQVFVNSNNANSALGAWQVGPYTPNPGSPSGTIALTNASPGSEHVCMLQYAYSYY